jgi:hypothetical protein
MQTNLSVSLKSEFNRATVSCRVSPVVVGRSFNRSSAWEKRSWIPFRYNSQSDCVEPSMNCGGVEQLRVDYVSIFRGNKLSLKPTSNDAKQLKFGRGVERLAVTFLSQRPKVFSVICCRREVPNG